MTLVLLLTGLVVGIISTIGTKLQAQLAGTLQRLAAREGLSSARAILPLDLRSLTPAAGDIRAGEARDSSLELRASVATGAVCGGSSVTLVFAPYLLANARSAMPSIQAGDTAWVFADSDTGESWRAVPIRAVHAATGACRLATDAAGRSVFDLDHQLAIDLRDSIAIGDALAVRITRPTRYAIYRAGDGLWYLGLRTWNAALGQFNGVQPLAGPYASAGPGGTRIEYFDGAGNVVPSGALDTRGIARIEWVIGALRRSGSTLSTDSTRLVTAVRNRR